MERYFTNIIPNQANVSGGVTEVMKAFQFTENTEDVMLNPQLLKHMNSMSTSRLWDMRSLAVAVEMLGAKRGPGQRINKETKKMERFFTNITRANK